MNVLLTSLLVALFAQASRAQSCNCIGCFDEASVSVSSNLVLHLASPCPYGQKAFVTKLNVASTDGSGFKIYTQEDPSSSSLFTAGSQQTAVTCFDMASSIRVGGTANDIYVSIDCDNYLQSCPIEYDIDFACIGDPTPSPTLAPVVATAAPTPMPAPTSSPSGGGNSGGGANPSSSGGRKAQVAAWQHDTTCPENAPTVSYCDCNCCSGFLCTSTWVGSIDMNQASCSHSSCRAQYASCPAEGENGSIGTMQSSSGTLIEGKVPIGECSTEGLNGGSYILTCAADDSWTLQLYLGIKCEAEKIIPTERYTGTGKEHCSAQPLSSVLRGGSVKVDCSPPDLSAAMLQAGVSLIVQLVLPVVAVVAVGLAL